jgi:ankyrin repeat protein
MILFGAEDYVREYLDSSLESRIFLHGVNHDGNFALWLAACERFPAVVELLLDRGANANFQNKDGRTPLMQAAL